MERLATIVSHIRGLRAKDHLRIIDAVEDLKPFVFELRKIIGAEIGPVLDKFAGKEVQFLADKQEAIRSVNGLLGEIGLKVQCPRTSRPSRLAVRTTPGTPQGLFQIEANELGKIATQTLSSKTFPSIKVVPAEPDRRHAPRHQPPRDDGGEPNRGR